jgi:hypothetical protein
MSLELRYEVLFFVRCDSKLLFLGGGWNSDVDLNLTVSVEVGCKLCQRFQRTSWPSEVNSPRVALVIRVPIVVVLKLYGMARSRARQKKSKVIF